MLSGFEHVQHLAGWTAKLAIDWDVCQRCADVTGSQVELQSLLASDATQHSSPRLE